MLYRIVEAKRMVGKAKTIGSIGGMCSRYITHTHGGRVAEAFAEAVLTSNQMRRKNTTTQIE